MPLMSNEQAADLLRANQITPQQYEEIVAQNVPVLTPEVEAEEKKLRMQMSNPLFSRNTMSDDAIRLEASKRAKAGENAPAQKQQTQEELAQIKQQEIDRISGVPQTKLDMQPQIITASAPSTSPILPPNQTFTTESKPPQVNPYLAPVGFTYDAVDRMKAGIQKEYQAGAEKAAEEAGYFEQLSKENERIALENQTKSEAENTEMRNRLDSMAAVKVDRDKFWGSKSTTDKIMAGIGLFLGAAGSGTNKAAEIINNAITQDIAIQQANIDKQENAFKQYLAVTKDARQAREATRIAALDNAKYDLLAIASRYQQPQMKARAQQMIAQIDAQKQAAEANLVGMTQNAAMQQVAYGMGGGQMNPELMQEKDRARYVPGLGLAYTTDDAKLLKSAAETKNKFDAQLGELIGLREKFGGEVYNRAAVERAQQLSKDLLLAYKNMQTLGVLSQSDKDIVDAIIPSDPLAFKVPLGGEDPILYRLQRFKDDTALDFKSKVKNRISAPEQQAQGPRIQFVESQTANPNMKTVSGTK